MPHGYSSASSRKMVALSCGVIACRYEASECDFRFWARMFMFPRKNSTVLPVASSSRSSKLVMRKNKFSSDSIPAISEVFWNRFDSIKCRSGISFQNRLQNRLWNRNQLLNRNRLKNWCWNRLRIRNWLRY